MINLASKLIRPDIKPHWKNTSEEEYHTDTDFVSSSSLKKISKSEKSFYVHHFNLIDREETKAQHIGKLAHLAVLEWDRFADLYKVIPEFMEPTQKGELSKNSKAAKEKRQAWIDETLAENPNAIFCTQKERDDILSMMYAIANHKDAEALLKSGVPELSGFYADPETGIACKIRPDFISNDQTVIVDLKTTEDVEINAFSRQIFNYGYSTSIAMYGAGAEIINQRSVDHYVFIAVEKKRPFEVAVYPLDGGSLDWAQQRYRSNLKKLSNAILRGGEFQPYQTTMQLIAHPHYTFGVDP